MRIFKNTCLLLGLLTLVAAVVMLVVWLFITLSKPGAVVAAVSVTGLLGHWL